MYCLVLKWIVLYSIVLYCFVLYCIIMYCIASMACIDSALYIDMVVFWCQYSQYCLWPQMFGLPILCCILLTVLLRISCISCIDLNACISCIVLYACISNIMFHRKYCQYCLQYWTTEFFVLFWIVLWFIVSGVVSIMYCLNWHYFLYWLYSIVLPLFPKIKCNASASSIAWNI